MIAPQMTLPACEPPPHAETVAKNESSEVEITLEQNVFPTTKDLNTDETLTMDLVKPAKTPIPYMKVIVLMFVTISEGISGSILNPFAGLMVLNEFGFKSTEVGYYVGWLTTSFFVGQLLSSYPLGWLSDKIGRRPIILLGLVGNAAMLTMFGLSKWLWWAMLARFLNGLLNSNRAAVKSYIREITDITNQAQVYSYRSAGYAIGFVLGPLVGGIFARPADTFPFNFIFNDWFFIYFPYLLPCLIAALINLAGLALGIFYLTESLGTLKSATKYKALTTESPAATPKHIVVEVEMTEIDTSSSINNDDEEELLEGEETHKQKEDHQIPCSDTATCLSGIDRAVVVSIFLYALVSLFWLMFQETFPVWAIQPTGLNMDETQIGLLNGLSAIFMIVFQVFIYHRIDNYFGSTVSLRIALLAFCPTLLAVPFCYYILNFDVQICTLLLLFSILNCLSTWSQASVNLMINNASPAPLLGKVNGASAFVSSFARVLAPICGTSLFTWSSGLDGPWPFNWQLVFLVIPLMSVVSLIITFLVPKYVNRSRKN